MPGSVKTRDMFAFCPTSDDERILGERKCFTMVNPVLHFLNHPSHTFVVSLLS